MTLDDTRSKVFLNPIIRITVSWNDNEMLVTALGLGLKKCERLWTHFLYRAHPISPFHHKTRENPSPETVVILACSVGQYIQLYSDPVPEKHVHL